MSNDILAPLLSAIKKHSPNGFISLNNELVVAPKNNIFIRLEGVESDLDLKCKVIAWLSRPSCKGVSEYWQKRIRAIVNDFLGTSFDRNGMDTIYTWLGNDCNRKLCIEFIESGYDLNLLIQKSAFC